jgi:hypothetical protein
MVAQLARILRLLKGAPVSIVLALLALPEQELGLTQLVAITGYSENTVRSALATLEIMGYTRRSTHREGWAGTPLLAQLIAGDLPDAGTDSTPSVLDAPVASVPVATLSATPAPAAVGSRSSAPSQMHQTPPATTLSATPAPAPSTPAPSATPSVLDAPPTQRWVQRPPAANPQNLRVQGSSSSYSPDPDPDRMKPLPLPRARARNPQKLRLDPTWQALADLLVELTGLPPHRAEQVARAAHDQDLLPGYATYNTLRWIAYAQDSHHARGLNNPPWFVAAQVERGVPCPEAYRLPPDHPLASQIRAAEAQWEAETR